MLAAADDRTLASTIVMELKNTKILVADAFEKCNDGGSLSKSIWRITFSGLTSQKWSNCVVG